MVRKTKRVALAAAAVVVTALLAPTHSAYAADGCGEGWYKGSDGYLTKTATWRGLGAHNATIYHSGRVRWCNENDPLNDDENRRAIIGYPQDSYPFESQVFKNGGYTKFCVRQTIQAHMTGIKSNGAWTIGGSISATGPGVNVSYSSSSHEATVTASRNAVCGASAAQVVARTGNAIVTAQNESGKVTWVHLTTTLTAQYTVNGAKYGDSFTLSEYDYS
jgi:hypothetical protein